MVGLKIPTVGLKPEQMLSILVVIEGLISVWVGIHGNYFSRFSLLILFVKL